MSGPMHVFVTKVEVTVGSNPIHPIDRCPAQPIARLVPLNYEAELEQWKKMSIEREFIESMKFVNERGEVVHVGMSKDVQNTIGLSFKALKEAKQKIDEYDMELYGLKKRFRVLSAQWNEEVRMRQLREERLSSLTLWERIRILFGADAKQIVEQEHILV